MIATSTRTAAIAPIATSTSSISSFACDTSMTSSIATATISIAYCDCYPTTATATIHLLHPPT